MTEINAREFIAGVSSSEQSGSERPQPARNRSGRGLSSKPERKTDEQEKARGARVARHFEPNRTTMLYLGVTVLLLAMAASIVPSGDEHGPIQPVAAGPIPTDVAIRMGPDLSKREDSPTDVCLRWAQQSALVNGTLYLYGGEAMNESSQTQNTWNNNFLTLDLTKNWQIASPALTGLPQPSGPPAVALGYLWHSYDSLYLYGGQFSWQPPEDPTEFALWDYQIESQQWVEHRDPTTSSGDNAPSNDEAVQRASEGAGVSVPSLGLGFYFGGHLDGYTTQGWSQAIPRIYLQSLLEFTFPGYTNDQVETLGDGQTAGDDGVYRNVTVGGLQSSAGFTERADGVLIFVPGFGEQGILLALAGGTNDTFTQMNNIDVYDIASSTWYKQSTSGETPKIRVNPCAVIAAAPDGSSYNIYMFGGQALQPYGSQEQYQDMWILTLPGFTWIEVDMSSQSVPYGRSGHTCNVWDGQMVVVGGYVGEQLSCESPGIYVFDMSNCQWVQEFTALDPGSEDSIDSISDSGSDPDSSASSSSDSSSGSGSSGDSSSASSGSGSGSSASANPLHQQPNQVANSSSPGGLEGSNGYTVPEAVIKVIGGDKSGGATVTTPIQTATGGPLATGKPITYTVTSSGGSTVTQTASSNSDGDGDGDGNGDENGGNNETSSSSSGGGGPNIAAIVVGVVCGVLFCIACYLAFCAYIYRKQLNLYKRHVEMSQRQARGEKLPAIPGLLATDASAKNSSERYQRSVPWVSGSESASQEGSYQTGGQTSSSNPNGDSPRRESEQSDTADLLAGQEPTFVGVLLNPRRSLKVVNRD